MYTNVWILVNTRNGRTTGGGPLVVVSRLPLPSQANALNGREITVRKLDGLRVRLLDAHAAGQQTKGNEKLDV